MEKPSTKKPEKTVEAANLDTPKEMVNVRNFLVSLMDNYVLCVCM
jgi:hypothetical protein